MCWFNCHLQIPIEFGQKLWFQTYPCVGLFLSNKIDHFDAYSKQYPICEFDDEAISIV